ncbi:4a-hydroxytetrahydrobiopterin dehydratase [Salinimicrobium sp. HB62]|uniref:4a-hydroxytetrahydrobiopterin dehydratase n=1 Tax=Salinimicrobium sp. HB62 TaxID=3077781 RepID=UPI002D77A57E|nr:4a-hydroxytetrahydrobiopterin dehydratase [Salinimicrobium sp. HB62]
MEIMDQYEINRRLEDLEGWEYKDDAIHTSFQFENFKECFSVMVRIAFEAEAQQHHPNWTNVYSELQISLSTHDAGGVTEKDFKLARSIENIVDAGE